MTCEGSGQPCSHLSVADTVQHIIITAGEGERGRRGEGRGERRGEGGRGR